MSFPRFYIAKSGVKFEFVGWDASCDGVWGHIFFRVEPGIYAFAQSDGAYHYEGKEVDDMDDDGHNITVATPCLEHGEDFETAEDLFQEAAEWADACLPKVKKGEA